MQCDPRLSVRSCGLGRECHVAVLVTVGVEYVQDYLAQHAIRIVSVSLLCVQLSVTDVRRCPATWTQVVRRWSISFKAECSSQPRDVDPVSPSQISTALPA